MRILPANPLDSSALVVRVGVRDCFRIAVTAEGTLILRLPSGAPGFARRLRAWGVRITPGAPPALRSARVHGSPFQLKVWQACRQIRPGQTLTYGQLAARVGCRSAQAVGTALGANPLAVLIPCHRVVATQGLGGFAWGLTSKRRWLRAEGHELA